MARKKADTSSAGGARASKAKVAERYTHPTETSPMRPDVGTQPQFRKKKTPTTWRYDSSLSPALDWDGQNGARELGEWLLAAERWVAAVNVDGQCGTWQYRMARSVAKVREILDGFLPA